VYSYLVSPISWCNSAFAQRPPYLNFFDILGLLHVGIFLTKSTSMPDGEY